jgi:hypothetical protein
MNDVASRPRGLLPGLAVSETVSWGICFYGFAVLLPPMERDLGWSRATLVGAFTIAVIDSRSISVSVTGSGRPVAVELALLFSLIRWLSCPGGSRWRT